MIGKFSSFIHHNDFGKPGPPSLGEQVGSGALVGAGIGAVAGAATGYVNALENVDSPLQVVEETYHSQRPELIGADYDDVDRRRRYNHSTERWETKREDDDWDPIIRYHDEKPYQKVRFEGKRTSPLGGALKGALTGAAIGAAVGAGGALAARLAGWEEAPAVLSAPNTNVFALGGAAVGATVGGLAGYHAGNLAQQNVQVEVRTAPVYETQQIGWMPFEHNARNIPREFRHGGSDFKIYYHELEGRFGDPPFEGQDRVHAQVQVGEAPKEYRSTSLTPVKGAIGGALLGGVVGMAGGVAAATLGRLIAGSE